MRSVFVIALGLACLPSVARGEPRTDLRPDSVDAKSGRLTFEDEVHSVRKAGKGFEVTFDNHQMVLRARKDQADAALKLKTAGKPAVVTASLTTHELLAISAK